MSGIYVRLRFVAHHHSFVRLNSPFGEFPGENLIERPLLLCAAYILGIEGVSFQIDLALRRDEF